MEPLTNTIYRIDEKRGIATPKYGIDFKQGNCPLTYDLKEKETKRFMKEFVKKGTKEWINLFSFHETDNASAFKFGYSDYMMTSFYSKKTKKVIYIGPIWINDIDRISMPTLSAVNEKGNFIGYIEAQALRQMVSSHKDKNKPSKRILELSENLRDTDNPVIVEFSLKEF